MRDIDETVEAQKLLRETVTLSRCDMDRSDIQFMDGNGVSRRSGSCPADGGLGESTPAQPVAAEAIWLCPSVVSLTGAEITAALYGFSDLVDDVTDHTCKAVRDELSFIVARYGTFMIEHVADWLVIYGAASLHEHLTAIHSDLDRSPSADRMPRCQQQCALLLRASAA